MADETEWIPIAVSCELVGKKAGSIHWAIAKGYVRARVTHETAKRKHWVVDRASVIAHFLEEGGDG